MTKSMPVRETQIRRSLRASGCFLSLCLASGIGLLAQAETPGKDGPITVAASNTILNEYSLVPGTLSAGQTTIPVSSIAGDLPSLSVGDLIMLYQAQGATISGVDSASYGEVTNLNNAGRYEFQTVSGISGNTIQLQGYGGACGGLTYNYDFNEAQVIRVPQATTLTVNSGTSLSAQSWNGSTGGVVAIHVEDTLAVNGTITANSRGFRGGVVDNLTESSGGAMPAEYVSNNARRGAEKGESIAGFQDNYPGGRYNRGAPANGGGGGNSHNAGGGGGANGNNGLVWNGQGNPNRSVASWDQAWNIDGSLTATTVSSGGGRGGYTYARDGDALTLPPGSWGNDRRREVGGLGGRPLTFEAAGRLFFGGGGGAGDGNNNAAGAGGRGGGLIFIIADTVTGSGQINANGQTGRDTSAGHNDAPGGGGAGGTIVIKANTLGSVQLRARGAKGGDQLITNSENEGPGGGGGGGVIAYSGGIPASSLATGGANGTTSASSMTEFIPNGATQGAAGQPNEAAPSDAALPFCAVPPGQLSATKSVSVWDPLGEGLYHLPGNDVVYTFDIENTGYTPVETDTIVLQDMLPPELIFYNGEFDPSDAVVTGPFEFEDASGVSGLSCCSVPAEAEFSNSPGIVTGFGYTPAAGYDPDVHHIKVSPGGEMAPQTSVAIRFRAKIK